MTPCDEDPAPPSVAAQLSAAGVTAEQQAQLADLADRIYGHALRVVDLDRLYQLEQCVWSELSRLEIHDGACDLATALLSEALHRVGYGSDRQASMIPDGISGDEVIAAEYDDACLICQYEVADMQYRLSGQKCCDLQRDAEDRDLRRFMEQTARAWRAENAAALRRFGLL